MRMQVSALAALYATVAAAEILVHWYAGTQDTELARSLRNLYLAPDGLVPAGALTS